MHSIHDPEVMMAKLDAETGAIVVDGGDMPADATQFVPEPEEAPKPARKRKPVAEITQAEAEADAEELADETKNAFIESDKRRKKAATLAMKASDAVEAVEDLANADLGGGEQLAKDEGLWLVVSQLKAVQVRLQKIADGEETTWEELVDLERQLRLQERREQRKSNPSLPGRHGFIELVAHTERGRRKLGEIAFTDMATFAHGSTVVVEFADGTKTAFAVDNTHLS